MNREKWLEEIHFQLEEMKRKINHDNDLDEMEQSYLEDLITYLEDSIEDFGTFKEYKKEYSE